MAGHMPEEFSLARLAEQAGMSEFHFNRLFKRATGVPHVAISHQTANRRPAASLTRNEERDYNRH
jgi:AraC-like DNA-binding protein